MLGKKEINTPLLVTVTEIPNYLALPVTYITHLK